MKRVLLAAILSALFLAAGCGNKEDTIDTPAGHPDELRDSTRLDPARDSTDSTHSGAGETTKAKKKYRFSS